MQRPRLLAGKAEGRRLRARPLQRRLQVAVRATTTSATGTSGASDPPSGPYLHLDPTRARKNSIDDKFHSPHGCDVPQAIRLRVDIPARALCYKASDIFYGAVNELRGTAPSSPDPGTKVPGRAAAGHRRGSACPPAAQRFGDGIRWPRPPEHVPWACTTLRPRRWAGERTDEEVRRADVTDSGASTGPGRDGGRRRHPQRDHRDRIGGDGPVGAVGVHPHGDPDRVRRRRRRRRGHAERHDHRARRAARRPWRGPCTSETRSAARRSTGSSWMPAPPPRPPPGPGSGPAPTRSRRSTSPVSPRHRRHRLRSAWRSASRTGLAPGGSSVSSTRARCSPGSAPRPRSRATWPRREQWRAPSRSAHSCSPFPTPTAAAPSRSATSSPKDQLHGRVTSDSKFTGSITARLVLEAARGIDGTDTWVPLVGCRQPTRDRDRRR